MEATATKTYRHFFRCPLCLEVFAADIPGKYFPVVGCAICGSERVEWMGYVQRQTIVRPEMYCPCDDRCTGAKGPKCECQCGGENHGKGILTRIITTAGKARMEELSARSLNRAGKAREQAEEFRSKVNLVREAWALKYGETYNRKMSGKWIENFDFFLTGRDYLKDIHHAEKLKTQSGRIRALSRIKMEMEG